MSMRVYVMTLTLWACLLMSTTEARRSVRLNPNRNISTVLSCALRSSRCKFLPWGEWSSCSSTCGGGVTSRSRKVCIRSSNQNRVWSICKIAKSRKNQRKLCNISCGVKGLWSEIKKRCICKSDSYGKCCLKDARVWSDWSEWSPCECENDGTSIQMRNRECMSMVEPAVMLSGCTGQFREIQKCHAHNCTTTAHSTTISDRTVDNQTSISSSKENGDKSDDILSSKSLNIITTTTEYETNSEHQLNNEQTTSDGLDKSTKISIKIHDVRIQSKRNNNDNVNTVQVLNYTSIMVPPTSKSYICFYLPDNSQLQTNEINPHVFEKRNIHDLNLKLVNKTFKSTLINHIDNLQYEVTGSGGDSSIVDQSDVEFSGSGEDLFTDFTERRNSNNADDLFNVADEIFPIESNNDLEFSGSVTSSTTMVSTTRDNSIDSVDVKSIENEVDDAWTNDTADKRPVKESSLHKRTSDPTAEAVDFLSKFKFETPFYFVKSPENITTKWSYSVMFECQTGPDFLPVEWYHNGVDMYRKGLNVLSIDRVLDRHLGLYECKVKREGQVILTTAAWLKFAVSHEKRRCYIDMAMRPQNVIARADTPLWVHCTPKRNFINQHWYKGSTRLMLNRPEDDYNEHVVQVKSNNLLFRHLKRSDAGVYSCLLVDIYNNCSQTLVFNVRVYDDIRQVCGRTILDEKRMKTLGQKKYRIVGGRDATFGSAPWMVSLIDAERRTVEGERVYCGGVLISDTLILTAAHCLTVMGIDKRVRVMNPGSVQLSFGSYNRKDDHQVKRRILHIRIEKDMNYIANDMALVELEEPIKFTDDIRPACLPRVNVSRYLTLVKPGRRGLVMGFGYLDEYGEIQPNKLQVISLEIQTPEKCAIDNYPDDNTFCAGSGDQKGDACYGDSGGPFLVRDMANGQRWTVVGLVSYGRGCNKKGTYGYYVNVWNRLPWINDQIDDMYRKTSKEYYKYNN